MQIKKSSFFAIIILVNGLFFAFGMLVATWLNTQNINNNTSYLLVPNISTTTENIVVNPENTINTTEDTNTDLENISSQKNNTHIN